MPKAQPTREQVPCDVDVERLILGSIQLNSTAMDGLRAVIEQDDFSLDVHRQIWLVMVGLYDRGAVIDRVTLTSEVIRLNQTNAISVSYIATLDDGLPAIENLDQYIAILKEKTLLRRILALTDNIGKRVMVGMERSDEVLDALSSGITALASNAAGDRRPISTREMIDQTGMDALLQPRRTEGLRLPWNGMNEALSGFHPGQMIVLAGVTGRGKTSFALQVATHATKQSKCPIVWTLEMSPRQMFNRMVNQMANVSGDRARQGILTDGAKTKRKEAAYWLHDHQVWFDRHSRTVPSFCASIRQAAAKSDVGIAIVDYLQLIRGSGRPESRTREVGENSRALKLAAMDLEIPILVLSQFHRTGDKEATMHSLKESGDIENDSDVILLLSSAAMDGDTPVPVAVKVAKQREGPAGIEVPLIFHPATQAFYSQED